MSSTDTGWQAGIDYVRSLLNQDAISEDEAIAIVTKLNTLPIGGKEEQEGFAMLEAIRPGGFIVWCTKQKLLGEE